MSFCDLSFATSTARERVRALARVDVRLCSHGVEYVFENLDEYCAEDGGKILMWCWFNDMQWFWKITTTL